MCAVWISEWGEQRDVVTACHFYGFTVRIESVYSLGVLCTISLALRKESLMWLPSGLRQPWF